MRKWGKSLLILGDEGGVLYFWVVFYGGETLLIVVCKLIYSLLRPCQEWCVNFLTFLMVLVLEGMMGMA